MIIRSTRPRRIAIGRHISIPLERGLYVYTGSALGRGSTSLEGRLGRHLSRRKKHFWHIDEVLSVNSTRLVSAIIAKTKRRAECKVNVMLLSGSSIKVFAKGIGSSDCKCEAHFLMAKCGLRPLQRKVRSSYATLGLPPRLLTVLDPGDRGFRAQPDWSRSGIGAILIRMR